MKQVLYTLCLLFSVIQANAQFYIAPGTTVSTNEASITIITLEDTDFINDGTFVPGTSDFYFVNSAENSLSIAGNSNTNFDWLYVDMGNQDLLLEQDIEVGRVIFQAGDFNLNGNEVSLTDIIENEDEPHSFIGPNGGAIVYQTNMTQSSKTKTPVTSVLLLVQMLTLER